VIASAARELLNKSENERSGVLSTAMSFLGLYRDPVVAKVTHHCDWRIRLDQVYRALGGSRHCAVGRQCWR
jgi:type IV secretory pathway TraG/TraD family ATPase VirD4